jgi:hypothetical protein
MYMHLRVPNLPFNNNSNLLKLLNEHYSTSRRKNRYDVEEAHAKTHISKIDLRDYYVLPYGSPLSVSKVVFDEFNIYVSVHSEERGGKVLEFESTDTGWTLSENDPILQWDTSKYFQPSAITDIILTTDRVITLSPRAIGIWNRYKSKLIKQYHIQEICKDKLQSLETLDWRRMVMSPEGDHLYIFGDHSSVAEVEISSGICEKLYVTYLWDGRKCPINTSATCRIDDLFIVGTKPKRGLSGSTISIFDIRTKQKTMTIMTDIVDDLVCQGFEIYSIGSRNLMKKFDLRKPKKAIMSFGTKSEYLHDIPPPGIQFDSDNRLAVSTRTKALEPCLKFFTRNLQPIGSLKRIPANVESKYRGSFKGYIQSTTYQYGMTRSVIGHGSYLDTFDWKLL